MLPEQRLKLCASSQLPRSSPQRISYHSLVPKHLSLSMLERIAVIV
jgi:hypothetical protein